MRTEDAPVISDTVMNGLLQIMERSSGKDGGGVMEDALLAVSTLIEGRRPIRCSANLLPPIIVELDIVVDRIDSYDDHVYWIEASS